MSMAFADRNSHAYCTSKQALLILNSQTLRDFRSRAKPSFSHFDLVPFCRRCHVAVDAGRGLPVRLVAGRFDADVIDEKRVPARTPGRHITGDVAVSYLVVCTRKNTRWNLSPDAAYFPVM